MGRRPEAVQAAFRIAREVVATVQNKWGTTQVSKYAYQNDDLGRPMSCLRTGETFSGGSGKHYDVWEYNDRNELTGSTRREGTAVGSGDIVTDLGTQYQYDPIGNPRSSLDGGAPNDTLYCCANNLNQSGETGADADCQPPSEEFQHDDDGNLTADGTFEYVWDAENRLIEVRHKSPSTSSQKKVTYAYDYMGRRIQRAVCAWDAGPSSGSSPPATHRNHPADLVATSRKRVTVTIRFARTRRPKATFSAGISPL
jgi:hypothetical protein